MRHGLVTFFGDTLPDFKIHTVHIGAGSAKGEIPPFVDFPAQHGRTYSFEPDAATLPNASKPNVTLIPCAISDQDGERDLFICRSTGASSFYRPNIPLLSRWHYGDQNLVNFHEVVETRRVQTRSLDSLILDGTIGEVDFLRLNIQGGELDALRGGQRALQSAVGVQIELSFDQTYVDAPLFSDIEPVLRSNGFVLFDLVAPHEISHSAKYRAGMANERYWRFPGGQLFESHCLFLKDFKRTVPTSEHKVMKLAAISEMYGQLSFALETLSLLQPTSPNARNTFIDRAISDFKARWQQYFA